MTEEELHCSGIAASVAVYLDHSVQLNGLRYWSTGLSDLIGARNWFGLLLPHLISNNWFRPVCQ